MSILLRPPVLVRRTIASMLSLTDPERAALNAAGCTWIDEVLGRAYTPAHRHTLALSTHIAPDRLARLLSIFELRSLPTVTEDEARLLAFLGVRSLARLSVAEPGELLRLQRSAHAPSMKRLGHRPLSAERLESIRQKSLRNPRFPEMPGDTQAAAGHRWRAGWASDLRSLLAAGDQNLPGVGAEVLTEAWTEALAWASSARPLRSSLQVAERAFTAVQVRLASGLPDTEEVQAKVVSEWKAMSRGLDPAASVTLANGLLSARGRALDRRVAEMSSALGALRACSGDLRSAFRSGQSPRLHRSLGGALAVLLHTTGALGWTEVALSPVELAECLPATEGWRAWQSSRVKLMCVAGEAAALASAIAALLPALSDDARDPTTADARRRRALARRRALSSAPLLADAREPEDMPAAAGPVRVAGDVHLSRDGVMRLYGATVDVRVEVQGELLRAELRAFRTTPSVVAGAWDPVRGVLILTEEAPRTWEEALLAEARRAIPWSPAPGLVTLRRTDIVAARLSTLAPELTHA